MKCSKCGNEELKIESTKTEASGILTRRRTCLNCGEKMHTMELPPRAVKYCLSLIKRWEATLVTPYALRQRQQEIGTVKAKELIAKGLTVDVIALETGLTVAKISRIELEQRRLRRKELRKALLTAKPLDELSAQFNVPVSILENMKSKLTKKKPAPVLAIGYSPVDQEMEEDE